MERESHRLEPGAALQSTAKALLLVGAREPKVSLKSGLPDCFWRDSLDVLLLQITEVFPTDFLKQGPSQVASQVQVPPDQLLDLGKSSHGCTGRKMLWVEITVLQTLHAAHG